jgi:hypothetical protein
MFFKARFLICYDKIKSDELFRIKSLCWIKSHKKQGQLPCLLMVVEALSGDK